MYMLLLAMHCTLLTMILLIFCRELVRVQHTIMNKFENFVNQNIEKMTSAKTLFKAFVYIVLIASLFANIYNEHIMSEQKDIIVNLKQRNSVADEYIKDLESSIEEQDFEVADICSTDSREEYNSWR